MRQSRCAHARCSEPSVRQGSTAVRIEPRAQAHRPTGWCEPEWGNGGRLLGSRQRSSTGLRSPGALHDAATRTLPAAQRRVPARSNKWPAAPPRVVLDPPLAHNTTAAIAFVRHTQTATQRPAPLTRCRWWRSAPSSPTAWWRRRRSTARTTACPCVATYRGRRGVVAVEHASQRRRPRGTHASVWAAVAATAWSSMPLYACWTAGHQ
jgi:hypothetical protein